MRTTDTRGGAMVKVGIERDSLGRAMVKDASYRLVYTVPPGIDTNRPRYHIVYPSDTVPDSRCRLFEEAAEVIFRKYNREVGRE